MRNFLFIYWHKGKHIKGINLLHFYEVFVKFL